MTGVSASAFFRSFHRKDFRLLWFSDAQTGLAEQMEFVVLSWYVVSNTQSPFLVGLYAALRFTGTLFAPYYGILTDRYDRRTLLVMVRGGFVIIAVIVLVLAFTDQLRVWQVFLIAAISGMGRALDNVARQSIIPDVVQRQELANAVALTRTARDLTQVVGPVIGGFMLEAFGTAVAYILIVVTYATATLSTTWMRPPRRESSVAGRSVLRNLFETGSYIRKQEVILALLLLAFLVNLTGFPLNNGLMPVFASDVLGTDASGLGLLLGAYAVGGFLGSLTIAGLPTMRHPGRVTLIGSIGWHAAILVMSQIEWFSVSVPVLMLTGIAQAFSMVTMSMMLLSASSPEIRGRIMGIRSLAVYGLPLGLVASGAAADAFGVSLALVINGVVGIVFTVLIAVWLRKLWSPPRS